MQVAIGRVLGISAALALGACAEGASTGAGSGQSAAQGSQGPVSANEMVIDTLVGGNFKGRAGTAWTRDEIVTQLASLECSGKRPAEVNVTQGNGVYMFNGHC